jgi:DMSO/TMAO reductase YedYZ molybdopterin-dependent catalytic subunit
MARGLDGYTTNIPLEYLLEDDTLLAYKLNGEPLPQEHGAPLRLVVPQLYAWKSAKYVSGLTFQSEWQPGFWEERGYHMIGDPWHEQRYTEPLEKVRAWWRKVRHTEIKR